MSVVVPSGWLFGCLLSFNSWCHLWARRGGSGDGRAERCRWNTELATLSFRAALIERYQQGDIVRLPFGEAHKEAIDNLEVLAVETGIGYPDSFLAFRIFESYAWKHWACGRYAVSPHNYWFVCPNYYDVDE